MRPSATLPALIAVAVLAAPGCRQLLGIDELVADADGPVSGGDAMPADAPIDAVPPDASVDAMTCGTGYVEIPEYPGHTYRAGTTGTAWPAASTQCTNAGAYLVVIDDAAEDLAVRTFMPDDTASPFFWVGVTDSATEGTWLTSTGSPATYLPWAPGQPTGSTNENCVLLGDAGGFSDWMCVAPQYFACECGSP